MRTCAVWCVALVLSSAVLMAGGPVQMSVGAYFGDIGLTYVSIPLVTWGLGAAWASGARGAA
jgi:hypothetical protein